MEIWAPGVHISIPGPHVGRDSEYRCVSTHIRARTHGTHASLCTSTPTRKTRSHVDTSHARSRHRSSQGSLSPPLTVRTLARRSLVHLGSAAPRRPRSAQGPSAPCSGSDSEGRVASSHGLTLAPLGLGLRVGGCPGPRAWALTLHARLPSGMDALNSLRV